MKPDILIAYYSWSGNTKKIAEMIKRKTGGTLFEIKPVQPYTTDYGAAVKQAKKEIRENFRPELNALPDVASCSVIFLGSPIWCSTMAPPLATFIDRIDLKGKIVVPFHTHGGGGGGTYKTDIANLCPDSTVKEGISIYDRGDSRTMGEVDSWLRAMGLSS